MKSALDEKIELERNHIVARQLATQICTVLEANIPNRCFHDAVSELADAIIRNGIELTSIAHRHQYDVMVIALKKIANAQTMPFRTMSREEMQQIATEALPRG